MSNLQEEMAREYALSEALGKSDAELDLTDLLIIERIHDRDLIIRAGARGYHDGRQNDVMKHFGGPIGIYSYVVTVEYAGGLVSNLQQATLIREYRNGVEEDVANIQFTPVAGDRSHFGKGRYRIASVPSDFLHPFKFELVKPTLEEALRALKTRLDLSDDLSVRRIGSAYSL